MESWLPWIIIILEEECYVLFFYDLGSLRTAYRGSDLVAHPAIKVEHSVPLNHLAHPGYYLRSLDNIDVRHHLSSRRLLGLAVPHPGHFRRCSLTWRRVLRQPGPYRGVVREKVRLLYPKPEGTKEIFLL